MSYEATVYECAIPACPNSVTFRASEPVLAQGSAMVKLGWVVRVHYSAFMEACTVTYCPEHRLEAVKK